MMKGELESTVTVEPVAEDRGGFGERPPGWVAAIFAGLYVLVDLVVWMASGGHEPLHTLAPVMLAFLPAAGLVVFAAEHVVRAVARRSRRKGKLTLRFLRDAVVCESRMKETLNVPLLDVVAFDASVTEVVVCLADGTRRALPFGFSVGSASKLQAQLDEALARAKSEHQGYRGELRIAETPVVEDVETEPASSRQGERRRQ